jgi:DNA-binding response OmpR family regulator
MLPEKDGFAVLHEVRKDSTIPVILLTARGEEPDRVVGLELGADDYVVKPFSPRELTARVRSVLRRTRPEPVNETLTFDDLEIDRRSREVRVGGRLAELTPREFDLLVFIASHPRQVFSRGQLLQHVWESSSDWQDPATVTVHIGRLRTKLEANPAKPRRIATVWGVGYRFEP